MPDQDNIPWLITLIVPSVLFSIILFLKYYFEHNVDVDQNYLTILRIHLHFHSLFFSLYFVAFSEQLPTGGSQGGYEDI